MIETARPDVGHGRLLVRSEVEASILAQVGDLWDEEETTFMLWDGVYYAPAAGELRDLIRHATVDFPASRHELLDCEDLAFLLRGRLAVAAAARSLTRAGLAVGVGFGWFDWVASGTAYHAACWALLATGALVWFEPQAPGSGAAELRATHEVGRVRALYA